MATPCRPVVIEDVVADKGYHAAATLAACAAPGTADVHPRQSAAGAGGTTSRLAVGSRIVTTDDGSQGAEIGGSNWRRSGAWNGASRTHLRQRGNGGPGCGATGSVRSATLLTAAARNLGLIMRQLFGIGTPRSPSRGLVARLCDIVHAVSALVTWLSPSGRGSGRRHCSSRPMAPPMRRRACG